MDPRAQQHDVPPPGPDKPGPASTTPPAPPPGAVPFQLHELLGVEKHELPLICPHCNSEVHQVIWRTFGNPGNVALVNPGNVALVGCSKCRKVLGAQLLGQIIY